jgi:hypothetical protein
MKANAACSCGRRIHASSRREPTTASLPDRLVSSRRSFDQDALVAVIAGEISANSDHCGDGNAQQRCSRAFGIVEDDGLPEMEKPNARPPFGVRLAAGEWERAERRDEKNALLACVVR